MYCSVDVLQFVNFLQCECTVVCKCTAVCGCTSVWMYCGVNILQCVKALLGCEVLLYGIKIRKSIAETVSVAHQRD